MGKDTEHRDTEQPTNEGTIANSITVSGGAFAGGKYGQATSNVFGADASQALAQAVHDLQRAIAALNLTPEARALVDKDVARLDAESKKTRPDATRMGELLESVADKLKLVGVIVAEVTALSGPAGKIAQLVGASLKALGLG